MKKFIFAIGEFLAFLPIIIFSCSFWYCFQLFVWNDYLYALRLLLILFLLGCYISYFIQLIKMKDILKKEKDINIYYSSTLNYINYISTFDYSLLCIIKDINYIKNNSFEIVLNNGLSFISNKCMLKYDVLYNTPLDILDKCLVQYDYKGLVNLSNHETSFRLNTYLDNCLTYYLNSNTDNRGLATI